MGSSWVTHVEKSCLLCHSQGLHITLCGFFVEFCIPVLRNNLAKMSLPSVRLQSSSSNNNKHFHRNNGILRLRRTIIFSGLIQHRAGQDRKRERQRHAMVADMGISLTSEGVTSPVLHNLKVISSNQSRYKPFWKDKVWTRELHEEYAGQC